MPTHGVGVSHSCTWVLGGTCYDRWVNVPRFSFVNRSAGTESTKAHSIMSGLELPDGVENTAYFVNENYKGLSETEIRALLNPLKIIKIPGLLDKTSILIIRSPDIPTLVICMMDSKDICTIAYMFA